MKLTLDLQVAVDRPDLPDEAWIRRWAQAALVDRAIDTELTVRLVDEAESAMLNATYRHKPGPTNVLSFPFEPPVAEVDTGFIGDVVICVPVVAREAVTQGKSVEAHWAHMVMHGVLHLLGYDHQEAAQAEAMERLEVQMLAAMGYPDPYGDSETS